MCALLRELIVPIEDLNRLAIECSKCKTVMIVDIRADAVIVKCGACQTEFEKSIMQTVRSLANDLSYLSKSGHGFSFRVAPPPEKP